MPGPVGAAMNRRPRPKRPRPSLTRPLPAFGGTIRPSRPGGRQTIQANRQKVQIGKLKKDQEISSLAKKLVRERARAL